MKNYTFTVKRGIVFLTVGLIALGSSNLVYAKSAEHKIKDGIDTTAEALKTGVEKTSETIDDAKDATKDAAHSVKKGVEAGVEKAGDKIDDAKDAIKDAQHKAKKALKKGIKKFGEKVEDIQIYFRKTFQEQVTVGPATLSEVTFNGTHMATIVHPGERIEGHLKYSMNKEQLKDVKYHSLIIGFKGREQAEAAVDIGRGIFLDPEAEASFTLIAPSEPGFYKVRFRPIDGYIGNDALNKWKDEAGTPPDKSTTIGLIYVKA